MSNVKKYTDKLNQLKFDNMYNVPFSLRARYPGISWWMGQPPWQGAMKQERSGTCSPFFRLGRGLMGFLWWTSWAALSERARTAAGFTPVKGL